MKFDKHEAIYLADYRPPAFFITDVDLTFELDLEKTRVTAKSSLKRNNKREPELPLVLNGRKLSLKKVAIDGRELSADAYHLDAEELTIPSVPDSFELEIVTELNPKVNTELEGLYCSSGNFCTQCEAEGFRKITFYIDRPDIMARFTTKIVVDRSIPVLLSNGNLVDHGELSDNLHYAVWQDPFPKPSYLFALVAGDLVYVEDHYKTRSGRQVRLQIFVEEHNRHRCDHAMQSLKKAMAWDEKVYGLEYDLDQYMVVAVDDFNMGAMENKGLNVFNSKFVLAEPLTATDQDYELIEAVIAHEYFHNWTGNRVTCRDWFQLSLKEGLTVFRDQQFSSDMISKAVKRISDVTFLRNVQFPEDGGPMAHSVRPDSYIEINNFYTVTVYEKGAEVIRMLHTLVGKENFRKGMDLYFERHDGQAVTTDDFVSAIETAAGIDLSQFRLWYSQAGTPEIKVHFDYDEVKGECTFKVEQNCPQTKNQPAEKPFHIPLALGLIDNEGNDYDIASKVGEKGTEKTHIFELYNNTETFVITNIPQRPVPSFLRSFSAPVKLHYDYTDEELCFLLENDADPFNRWEAGQRLFCRVLLNLISSYKKSSHVSLPGYFVETFGALLKNHKNTEASFLARLLTLPSDRYLGECMESVDVEAIHTVRQSVIKELALILKGEFEEIYNINRGKDPYRYSAKAAGERSLKNTCLFYRMTLNDEESRSMGTEQFIQSDNMTDVLAALKGFVHNQDCPEKKTVIVSFYNSWQKEPLVLDKWFSLQATAPFQATIEEVQLLSEHPLFSIKNPNRVRALIGAFASGNEIAFHDLSGKGYTFIVDKVLQLNKLNPQIGARLLGVLSRWRRYDRVRQDLMKEQLERVLAADELAKDIYEVAARSLGKV